MEKDYLILITPKLDCNLLPHVALFDAFPGNQPTVSVHVPDFATAMRNFKMSVTVDTSVTKKVYPYANAISLQWEDGESDLIEQVDSFDFMHDNQISRQPEKINVRVYQAASSVQVMKVSGRVITEWADVARLDQLYSLSEKGLQREILQRAFTVISRINLPVD
jgi:hypothetical protein